MITRIWSSTMFLFLLAFTTTFAQPTFEWVKTAGGLSSDISKSVEVNSSGDIYSCGYFGGNVDFDPGIGIYNMTSLGLTDAYIQKLDENGSFLWSRQLGGATSATEANSIAIECEVPFLTAPTATDNCSGSVVGTHNALFPITSNTTVTWSYNDGNGNTTTQSQEVVVTPTDNSIAQVDATTLMANEIGNTYQWVDCNDGNSAIAGETDQSFTVISNGSYAVEIDNGNCTAMSTCIQILTVGIEEVNSKSTVYTSSNQLTIIFNDNVQSGRMSMIDVSGRSVLTTDLNGTRTTLEINVPVGVYLSPC
jgi:hypothetical protein